jgi:GNAT superfamily N-acetyltransferase
MTATDDLVLRSAVAADTALLLEFIRELAEAEQLPFPVTATTEDLLDSLFGARPVAEALLGFVANEPVCFAVFFETFSTTTGKRGLHLDDLFVREKFQGRGYGKKILSHIASIAEARNCARFEWWCLKTNERAINFYQSIGARPMEELIIFRMQNL